jgi:anaerobic selenocysteine-containing dehydrogenase
MSLKSTSRSRSNIPDKASPGIIVKLGRKVEGGVGPDGDIVAFSTLCPHKGYPLGYGNNGRANHVWQSIYLDQYNDFVMGRWPLPYLELNPADMKELGLNPGDLVEVYNDNGSTQAMAQPRTSAKPKQTFMLFAYPTGPMGNVVSKGVNELIIPNYKQTWANIRKIADVPEVTRSLSFKSQEYVSG